MRVFWKIGDMYTEMMQVHPVEIGKARKRLPNMTGVPHVYALIGYGENREVEWWPDCLMGEPVVRLDPYETDPLRQSL